MMKKILLILAIPFIMIALIKTLRTSADSHNKKVEDSLKQLHLELTGIVNAKKELGHGVSKILLDIKTSNINHYQPQDSLVYYLCTIDKNKAELITSNEEDFYIGDSVVISSKKDSCYVYGSLKILKSKWKRYIVSYHAGTGY